MTFLFLVIALISAFFPWLDHPVAALSFNAYDLAEWVSLIPDVRNGSPPMIAPLLVRLTFAGLALCFALQAIRARRTPSRLFATLLTGFSLVWLVPPIEFFRNITRTQDTNHWQQAALLGITVLLIAALVILRRRLTLRIAAVLLIGLPLITAISAGIGTLMAAGHIRPLRLSPAHDAGFGIIVLVLALISATIATALPHPTKR